MQLLHSGNVRLLYQGRTFPKKLFCRLSNVLLFFLIWSRLFFVVTSTPKEKHSSSVYVIEEQIYGHCNRSLPNIFTSLCQVWLFLCHGYWNRVLSFHCDMPPTPCLLVLISWWMQIHAVCWGKDSCTMIMVLASHWQVLGRFRHAECICFMSLSRWSTVLLVVGSSDIVGSKVIIAPKYIMRGISKVHD
jgi:hypothetical protein